MKTDNDFPGAFQFRAWSWLQARGPRGSPGSLASCGWAVLQGNGGRRRPSLVHEEHTLPHAPDGERLRRREGTGVLRD